MTRALHFYLTTTAVSFLAGQVRACTHGWMDGWMQDAPVLSTSIYDHLH